jgi:hypothetical protein
VDYQAEMETRKKQRIDEEVKRQVDEHTVCDSFFLACSEAFVEHRIFIAA